jgi:hypothetical protein
MTLWVNHDGPTVTIHGNIGLDVSVQNGGVREYSISEDAAHLRSFWGQLGKVLDEAEKPVEV